MKTFTPKEYMKIDIANNFGLDKLPWEDRIAWFDANESNLGNLYKQADEPALMFAGILAWEKIKAGEPTGYMIGLDATCSGLQILAAMTGDRRAAELCNVVDTGSRRDAYTGIYEDMCQRIGERGRIQRSDTKSAIMTSLYGSTAIPKRVFGEGELLYKFYDSMKDNAPFAWELNEAFLNMWNPEALSHDWTLPDNFHVHVKVTDMVTERVHFMNEPVDISYQVNRPSESGRSIGANVTHSIDGMMVREITRMAYYGGCKYQFFNFIQDSTGRISMADAPKTLVKLIQHYEKSGFLSSRVLEYINADTVHLVPQEALEELLNQLPNKPFTVVAIHDCFKVLANYGNDIRKLYNYQLYKLASTNLLSYLISQIMGEEIVYESHDPTIAKDILEADYALS